MVLTSTDACHAVNENFILLVGIEMGVDLVSEAIEVVTDRGGGEIDDIEFLHLDRLRIRNDRRFDRHVLARQNVERDEPTSTLTTM